MTLKYESELLFDLMKRDGDVAPSDVLPYESELKEKYLNQVVGAYPKLQDYRPEWLNYNLYHHLPSDFPVETLSNVTSTTVDNVVPYAYKSAILKGNTLVNLAQSTNSAILNGEYVFRDNFELLSFGCDIIKPSTTYTIISNIIENSANFLNLEWNTIVDECAFKEIIRADGSLGIRKFKVTSKDDLSNASKSIRFFPNNKQENGTLTITFMILEGDYTNQDIPYFEGMQSVKLPVLITSNEDGTKTNILSASEDVELRGIGDVQDTLDCLTGEVTQRIGEIVLDGSEDWKISGSSRPKHLRLYLMYPNLMHNKSTINDKFADTGDITYRDIEGIYISNSIDIQVEHSRLSEVSVDGFKNWLRENNIKVHVILSQASVKTVGLSCINEQGESATFRPIEGTMHVNTSSQTLPPLLDMSVPVEATTQNLMSFANIEEEE